MKLENKVVLITGASDGIGKEIAFGLAKEKAKIALIGRDEAKLSSVVEDVKKAGSIEARSYICDIREEKTLESVIQSIVSDFGTIDILINNAGIWQKVMTVDELEKEIINEVIETNLIAPINVTRLVLPVLRTRNEGAIINIISKSGVTAQAGQSVYTASKYGMRGFTEVLKADLKGTNVRVAGVYQSGTNTKMFEKTGEDFPTEKFTNPSDLADAVVYLLSRPEKMWIHEIQVEY